MLISIEVLDLLRRIVAKHTPYQNSPAERKPGSKSTAVTFFGKIRRPQRSLETSAASGI